MGEVFKGDSCEVEVILDSISAMEKIRLTTIRLRYWRPIHSELMTHRVFSRNARSSRAVPVVTLLKEEPYIPLFEYNQPGMQATGPLTPTDQKRAEDVWRQMMEWCKDGCKQLTDIGVHKQWANRPLEWFGWIDVLVTSTDWANWFALRDHSDAAPEIHELARLMDQAMNASSPNELWPGDWHLPYILEADQQESDPTACKILSAARCARISYKPFDGNAAYEKEKERYDRLVMSAPVHASPTEHQATPDAMEEIDLGKGQTIRVWQRSNQQGNFVGWVQHRKEIANEAQFDAHYER